MSDAETPDQGCRNLRWALALLDGLVRGGLQQLVLSPGSRSTPLVLAAQRCTGLKLTPILDERSAAFFALGLAEASGHPVGLLCTSGSAPAHWLPAVIEASESGVPLILLSADRPPDLRGWGANQTIDQSRLFGAFAREFHDPGPARDGADARKAIRALGVRVALMSQGPWPGPVHVNLPFREPLVPGTDCAADPEKPPDPSQARDPARFGSGSPALSRSTRGLPVRPRDLSILLQGRGIICCGPSRLLAGSSAAIQRCADMLGAPVLADPLSGLRFGAAPENRITRYDSLLRNLEAATALKPDWVLRFGGTPVSKALQEWLNGVPAILVDPGARWNDPSHDVWMQVIAEPETLCDWLPGLGARRSPTAETDPAWLGRWKAAELHLDRLATAFLEQAGWCEGHLIVRLLDRLPARDGLFCANSLPIRQLDTWSGQGETPLRFFGHRGASGIDGQTSTLAGLNAGRTTPAQGVTGLLGDLSFLHDLSGLMLMDRLDRPCVVLNNGGGRIFDYLPQRGLADFERLWRTPPRVELGALTRSFGIRHRSVDDPLGFEQALDEAIHTGVQGHHAGVIEVRLDAELSRRVHRGFWQCVREQSIIESL